MGEATDGTCWPRAWTWHGRGRIGPGPEKVKAPGVIRGPAVSSGRKVEQHLEDTGAGGFRLSCGRWICEVHLLVGGGDSRLACGVASQSEAWQTFRLASCRCVSDAVA
jgi:hypothetical protein